MGTCLYTCIKMLWEARKECQISLELELQAFVNCLIWELNSRTLEEFNWTSRRAVTVLNNSSASQLVFQGPSKFSYLKPNTGPDRVSGAMCVGEGFCNCQNSHFLQHQPTGSHDIWFVDPLNFNLQPSNTSHFLVKFSPC